MDDIEWEQVAEWADELRNAPRSEEAERKIYHRRYYVANRDRILARQRERMRRMREEDPEAYRAYLDRRNARARERRNAKKAAQTAGKEST